MRQSAPAASWTVPASGRSVFAESAAPTCLVLVDSPRDLPEDVRTRCLSIASYEPCEDRLRTKLTDRLPLWAKDRRLAQPHHCRHAGDENDAKQLRCQVGIERRDKTLKKR